MGKKRVEDLKKMVNQLRISKIGTSGSGKCQPDSKTYSPKNTINGRIDMANNIRLLKPVTPGSAGLLAGCRVDLLVHAALYTNRKNVL